MNEAPGIFHRMRFPVIIAAAAVVDGRSLHPPVLVRSRPLRMMARYDLPEDDQPTRDSSSDSLSFDMGLLKLPRLTTPQRASYENWRKRQQDRATGSFPKPGDTSATGRTPLGQDPVEGDPVDLSMYDESGWPTPEQIWVAEQNIGNIGMEPRGDDFDSDVDRLLGH
jgi:hypothetical protein